MISPKCKKTIRQRLIEKLHGQTLAGMAAIATILALCIMVVPYLSQFTAAGTPVFTPTPMAFAPAKDGESLIIVANFENRSDGTYKGVQPADYVFDELRRQVAKQNSKVRIERLAETHTAQSAKAMGHVYSATLVLSGWYDRLSVSLTIDRIQKSRFGLHADPERTSIANPDQVELVMTELVPKQATFFSLLTLGLTELSNGTPAEALTLLNQIPSSVLLDDLPIPYRVEFFFSKGFCASAAEHYDQAIAEFTKAIDLKPDYVVAYNNRGVAHHSKGNYDQAIQDYTKAIEIKPEYAIAYYNRGVVYQDKGNFDQAIQDYTKAIELKPDYAKAYYNRGNVNDNNGNYDSAISDFTKAIELKSDYAFAYNNRGNIQRKRGNYVLAMADFTKAIDLKPDYAFAYNNRGNIHGEKGNYVQAIADYTNAIDLQPDYALAYKNRGRVYKVIKANAKAITDFRKYLSLGGKDVEDVKSDLRELGIQQ